MTRRLIMDLVFIVIFGTEYTTISKGFSTNKGSELLAVFFVISAAPDGADGVNHVLCRQIVAFGRFGFAGLATAQQTTLGKQARSGCAMDGAIHSASAQQRTVGRVDDCIDRKAGYVSLKNLNGTTHNLSAFKKERVFPYLSISRTVRQQSDRAAPASVRPGDTLQQA